jgi:CRISPR-associated protein Csm3
MKLEKITTIKGEIELKSGLHIGGGDNAMRIGGVDNQVIKNPANNQPYIPGSSLKGKMRSLLEWNLGLVGVTKGKPAAIQHFNQEKSPNPTLRKNALKLVQLMGNGKPFSSKEEELAKEVGITRTCFNDCLLSEANPKVSIEIKTENSIDRISSRAENPRQTERVPAGTLFGFEINLKVFSDDSDDFQELLLKGMRLLELDALGGSGTRGYGKIKFINVTIDGKDHQNDFDNIDPFTESNS